MGRKQTRCFAVEEKERDPKAEEEHMDSVELLVKMSLKDITREEKMKEAGKPLYLERYE